MNYHIDGEYKINPKLYWKQYDWVDKKRLKFYIDFSYCSVCDVYHNEKLFITTQKAFDNKTKYIKSWCYDCYTYKQKEISEYHFTRYGKPLVYRENKRDSLLHYAIDLFRNTPPIGNIKTKNAGI